MDIEEILVISAVIIGAAAGIGAVIFIRKKLQKKFEKNIGNRIETKVNDEEKK